MFICGLFYGTINLRNIERKPPKTLKNIRYIFMKTQTFIAFNINKCVLVIFVVVCIGIVSLTRTFVIFGI